MLTRRTLMKGALVAGAYAGGVGLAGRFGGPAKAQTAFPLTVRRTEALITDKGPTRNAMTYGEGEIPPVLRMRRGQPFSLRLDNRLDEPTTVHWHGLRIDNKMDGVPFLTQPYVYGGDGFDYAFTPPDAGTFWRVIQNHKVKSFFTAPTALRAIKREDPSGSFIKDYNLKNLQALFLAGERADPATIEWAQQHLGVPVIDHWWQTETGWAIAGNPVGIGGV